MCVAREYWVLASDGCGMECLRARISDSCVCGREGLPGEKEIVAG